MEADGRQINLDGAIFLNLTLGATTTSQLVDVTPQVTCLFLPKNACQELRVTPLDLPAQTAMTSRVAEYTAIDNKTVKINVCDQITKSEVLRPAK